MNSWKAAARGHKCVLIGDINLDNLKWNDPEARHVKMVDIVKNTIETIGFCQVISGFTRSWPQQQDSAVDLCWTNDIERVINHSNSIRSGSDHNVITVWVRMKDRILDIREKEKRMWKNMDPVMLKDMVKNADWTELLLSDNIDVMNGILEKVICDALDKVAPMKVVQTRRNFKNWVTNDLKDKMTHRNSLREKARVSSQQDDWDDYRKARNIVTKETKRTRDDFFEGIYDKLADGKDTKGVYGTTKELLGLNRDTGPRCFLVNGQLLRKPSELANTLVDCYETKLNTLRTNLTPKTDDPLNLLKNALDRWEKKDQFQIFKFRKISILETSQLVSRLGNTTSCGHDKIDSMTVKLILPLILIPLNHIINTSLSQNKFAMKWKLSKVVPLLKDKTSNRLDPTEYRPISLLSTVSKVVERAAQLQLLKYFEDTEQLNHSGHAYRASLSTTTTIAQICQNLYEATEKRNIAALMTVDQSSAFDCLSHDILINKL